MNTVNIKINIILNREENHLIIQELYLEIAFVVADNARGVFAKNANIELETSCGRTIEYIDHCHPNILMCKL